jgi:predicted transcriptional regulator
MPPKRSITLTEAELRLMRILWERGESAVAEIVAAVAEQGPLAYTSVLTTIRVLESKKAVRSCIPRPLLNRRRVVLKCGTCSGGSLVIQESLCCYRS